MAETKKTTAAAKKTTAAKTTKTTTKAAPKTAAPKAAQKKANAEIEVKVEAPAVAVAPAAPAKKAEVKKQEKGLQVKLVKSASGRLAKQKKTLVALGLHKINQTVIKPDNACTRGMIFVVRHLVEVTEVK